MIVVCKLTAALPHHSVISLDVCTIIRAGLGKSHQPTASLPKPEYIGPISLVKHFLSLLVQHYVRGHLIWPALFLSKSVHVHCDPVLNIMTCTTHNLLLSCDSSGGRGKGFLVWWLKLVYKGGRLKRVRECFGNESSVREGRKVMLH